MCFNKRRRKQERIARQIAEKYEMLPDYRAARREGLSPIEAFEDWNLLKPEDYKLFDE